MKDRQERNGSGRKQIIVKLNEKTYQLVKRLAEKYDMPMSLFVRYVLVKWIEEHERGEKDATEGMER